MNKNTTKYMAFDPGKRTGWATFNADGLLFQFGTIIGEGDLTDFLEEKVANYENLPSVFIYEDYRIDPNIPQGGTRPVASESIGIIKSFARRNKIEVVNQPNTILNTGLAWAGIRRNKGHLRDDYSAIAHGTYYLQKNGLRNNSVMLELLQKDKQI